MRIKTDLKQGFVLVIIQDYNCPREQRGSFSCSPVVNMLQWDLYLWSLHSCARAVVLGDWQDKLSSYHSLQHVSAGGECLTGPQTDKP